MRSFTIVSNSVWKSRKFNSLGDDIDAKLLYLYVLSGPHANSAGCYDLPEGYACADLGWSAQAFRKALARLSQALLLDLDEAENTVRIVNWFRYNQPTNPNHAHGVLAQLEQASSDRLKLKALQEFTGYLSDKRFMGDKGLAKALARLSQDLAKACATDTDTDTDTERDTDTDTEIETETLRTVFAREASADAASAAPDGASASPLGEAVTEPKPEIPRQGHDVGTIPEHLEASLRNLEALKRPRRRA